MNCPHTTATDDPELAAVVARLDAAWPQLSQADRIRIVAYVEGVTGGKA